MDNQKELAKEHLITIAHILSADYDLSLNDAVKAVENLDLLNIYEDDYEFILREDISTWVDLAYESYETNTKVSQLLRYSEQPTTKNTNAGDMISYKDNLWFNNGDIVVQIGYAKKGNNMGNYIVINGKKAELTEEQLNYLCMFNRFAQIAKEQFGLTITQKETAGETFKTLFGVDFSDCSERKNPFNSELEDEDSYFIIDEEGVKTSFYDSITDKHRLNNVNSFNDKDFANQVYLHELLNRKLLKYAYDNNAEDCEWDKDDKNLHYYIYFDTEDGYFEIDADNYERSQNIYFSKAEVTRQAIKAVVEPFMKEHPEFVW